MINDLAEKKNILERKEGLGNKWKDLQQPLDDTTLLIRAEIC